VSDKTLTDICFDSFALHPSILQGLNEAGFLRCTPIQAMTLPLTLAGRDVAGQAQTGTGKTAAFLVALFQRLLTRPAIGDRKSTDPRAVILAPTRELAIQIEKDAEQIGRYTGIRRALIYGGVDYDKQRQLLGDGVDVIIATPGRLIDFVRQRAVELRSVDVLVMDEADRMFDLGFIKDIRFLIRRMPSPSQRQNMLFSATLSHRVLELAYEHMNEPEKLVVETESITAARVRQAVYFPASEEKLPLLLGLLSRMENNRGIIFVNTKVVCERVARALERAGHRVGVLSGDVPQKKRESLLAGFVQGDLELLVATDVAARGLHIPAVSHVFNYDLPFDAEDYVHRIGRTARLGAEGDAISFACDEYAIGLPDIEAFIEQKLPVVRIEPEMLIASPRAARPAAALTASGQSVVSEALAEAAAERKKRRERERGDGKRSSGGRSDARPPRRDAPTRPAGAPATARSSSANPVLTPGPAAIPSPAPVSAQTESAEIGESGRKRRRRRNRGERRGEGAAATAQQPAASVPAAAAVPLLARIKSRLKSLFQRSPGPTSRH